MVNRYGNNIECDFIKKIRIPIFDQQGATDNGTRYYFPENPQIDKNLIVGIEAHIQNYDLNVPDSATIGLASQLFFSFYNKNKEEIFYNVPYFSLFNNSLSPFKKKSTRIQKKNTSDKRPGPECLSVKFSSSNLSP